MYRYLSRASTQRTSSTLVTLVALALVSSATGLAWAQDTNEIAAITPDLAEQGTTSLLVTFTLETDIPPPPPVHVAPDSVAIGGLSGTSVSRPSWDTVTASFDIPAAEPVGAKDAAVTFTTPHGTLVFAKAGGFEVVAGAETAPAITQHPRSQTVRPGASVTFAVTATGTEPLTYQWQRDGVDLPAAILSVYSISSATESDEGEYCCIVTNDYGFATSDAAVLTVDEDAPETVDSYVVVDTGQDTCYDDGVEIASPAEGEAFYGQDAQYDGNQPSYTLSADGLTVYDNNTGLTWQQSADTDRDGDIEANDKLGWAGLQAYPAALNAEGYGGHNNWRLPTIKELYSLIDFRGTDPSGYAGVDTSGLVPYIDTDYFDFAYGDTSAGERIIDAQYASSTLYVGGSGADLLFGVNLADGRIKGYGLTLFGRDKTFFVICVRGNTNYGVNDFVDNGDHTITDRATGLMWAQDDSGVGLNWGEALAWVEAQNAANYLGYGDWRLPNAKELQSIVDYTRSPDTTSSAAIDPVLNCTAITNEAGATDYPFYWTGTTHVNWTATPGAAGAYLAFGRGLGYMFGWTDVHGAGCQRSDPKAGDPADWPTGHGPQGDAIRIYNYVRCVRDATAVAPPVIRVRPKRLKLTAEIGACGKKTLKIKNKGGSALEVSSVTAAGVGFSVLSPEFPQTVDPGNKVKVKVQYCAEDAEKQTGVLTILSNDPDQPEVTVKLKGKGR